MTGETRRLEETLVTDHAEVGSLVPVLFLVEDDGIPIRESETLSLTVPVTSSNFTSYVLSRDSRSAAFLALEDLSLPVHGHVLPQVGVGGERLVALGAGERLDLLVNSAHTVCIVFNTERAAIPPFGSHLST